MYVDDPLSQTAGRISLTGSPGFPTDMTAPFSKNFEATNGVMPRELVPQQRMGNEEELAGSIIYLASKVCLTAISSYHITHRTKQNVRKFHECDHKLTIIRSRPEVIATAPSWSSTAVS